MTTENLEATLAEHKRKARALEADAEKARLLGSAIEDMKKDVARLQKRHDAFTEIGDDHLESAFESYDQRFNTMIQWQPMRSILSGHQLAARVEVNLEHLRGEIDKAEQEIESLLAEDVEAQSNDVRAFVTGRKRAARGESR